MDLIEQVYGKVFKKFYIRASALGIVNAKCKENLAFQAPKCLASGIVKPKHCKFFCNTATMQF